MATNTHKPIAWGALASIIVALAIGSLPVVAMMSLQQALPGAEVAL
ncbi:MAG TPA: hypothetical protein VM346_01180 [Sphingomicrobium sp.]|nr:hypothetical protein [Sphingomicrobium sp.]